MVEEPNWQHSRRKYRGRSFAQKKRFRMTGSAVYKNPAPSALTISMPIADSVRMGRDVSIPNPQLVNLYGCSIGDETKIGAFVEIQKGAEIGARCKISSHTFICEGVTIEDGVFVGHGVVFINDRIPAAVTASGELKTEADWKLEKTLVRKRAAIGSGAVILCGVTIGEGAVIGAGAVVTHDVAPGETVAGVPARLIQRSSEWSISA